MSETADALIKFFTESEFWATNHDFLTRDDVIHHEVHFETSIDPISLEYLFLEYLGVLERSVESIGHAIVGDTAYIKLYTIERPILNAVWKYNANVVISPQDPWYVSWSDADVASYLERVGPRRATAEDAAKVEEFFESEAWLDVASKLHDSETEHFHVFVRTELHPDDLDHHFRRRVESMGFSLRVPTFYLAQPQKHPLAEPGREAVWLGYAPAGIKSFEVSCIFAPGIVLSPKELTAKERLYGGDGWTTNEYRQFVLATPRSDVLTPAEARVIATAMAF